MNTDKILLYFVLVYILITRSATIPAPAGVSWSFIDIAIIIAIALTVIAKFVLAGGYKKKG